MIPKECKRLAKVDSLIVIVGVVAAGGAFVTGGQDALPGPPLIVSSSKDLLARDPVRVSPQRVSQTALNHFP